MKTRKRKIYSVFKGKGKIKNALPGRYTLLSHGILNLQNSTFAPSSLFLKGELIYSMDGFVSVLIFFNTDNEIPRQFLAYSGRYEILGNGKVVHKIDICSNSNQDKTNEIRNYQFEDNNVLLLYFEIDKSTIFQARWEKII